MRLGSSSLILGTLALCAAGCEAGPPSDYARLPHAANALTSAVLGDALYVLGGHHGGAHASSVEDMDDVFMRLDLSDPAASWEELPAPGAPVQQATLFVYDDEVHRIGGLTTTHQPGEDKALFTLDQHSVFRGGEWVDLEPLPESRASHVLTLIGDVVVIAGGWVLAGDADDFVYVETSFWKDLSDPGGTWMEEEQPFQIRDVCGGTFEGKAYLLGGMLSGVFPKTTRVWDPEVAAWTEGPDLPAAGGINGFGCAAASDDQHLYLSHRNGTVYTLDEGGADWSAVAEMKQPRTFHSVALRGSDELIAVGGSDGATNNEFDAVESIALR